MRSGGNFMRGGLGRIGLALVLLAASVLLSLLTGSMAGAAERPSAPAAVAAPSLHAR